MNDDGGGVVSSSSGYLPHVDNHRLLRRRTHGYTTRLRLDFGAVVRARHGHHHLVGLSRHLPIYLPAYLSDHLPVEEEEEEVPGLAWPGWPGQNVFFTSPVHIYNFYPKYQQTGFVYKYT